MGQSRTEAKPVIPVWFGENQVRLGKRPLGQDNVTAPNKKKDFFAANLGSRKVGNPGCLLDEAAKGNSFKPSVGVARNFSWTARLALLPGSKELIHRSREEKTPITLGPVP